MKKMRVIAVNSANQGMLNWILALAVGACVELLYALCRTEGIVAALVRESTEPAWLGIELFRLVRSSEKIFRTKPCIDCRSLK